MPVLAEEREKLLTERQQLKALFDQHKRADGVYDLSAEQLEEVDRRNAKVNELHDLVVKLEAAEQAAAKNGDAIGHLTKPVGAMVHPGGKANGHAAAEVKGLDRILRESQEYMAFVAGRTKTASFEISGAEYKALLALTDINNVATRRPGIVESAQEERTVADMVLQGTTDNNTLTYMEETTFTNAAAAVAEGGTKPESTLDFTERTDNVRKIATWIPATRELLQDVRGIESYIRGRLMFMVERVLEQQILTGDGVAPNILGIHNRSGVQTQAKGADPVPDAIYKGITLVRNTGFAEPTGVVFHPNDWQDVRLLRTTDGIYIWGNPSEAGVERIWGLPIRVTTAETQNTALVGAFRPFAQLFEREGVTVTVSTEHSTYFVENKVAILAEMRAALAVYRPAAFCKVTGI